MAPAISRVPSRSKARQVTSEGPVSRLLWRVRVFVSQIRTVPAVSPAASHRPSGEKTREGTGVPPARSRSAGRPSETFHNRTAPSLPADASRGSVAESATVVPMSAKPAEIPWAYGSFHPGLPSIPQTSTEAPSPTAKPFPSGVKRTDVAKWEDQ